MEPTKLKGHASKHVSAIDPQERFKFGANWARFLTRLSEDRIAEAEKSLQDKLGKKSLKGLTFLDIGCGSGLFSLAACRLGAKVTSFDYDTDSVGCARYLKEKYTPKGAPWDIHQGSILDATFLSKFKGADIVYSHRTHACSL